MTASAGNMGFSCIFEKTGFHFFLHDEQNND